MSNASAPFTLGAKGRRIAPLHVKKAAQLCLLHVRHGGSHASARFSWAVNIHTCMLQSAANDVNSAKQNMISEPRMVQLPTPPKQLLGYTPASIHTCMFLNDMCARVHAPWQHAYTHWYIDHTRTNKHTTQPTKTHIRGTVRIWDVQLRSFLNCGGNYWFMKSNNKNKPYTPFCIYPESCWAKF
jgi:hypothetical protein